MTTARFPVTGSLDCAGSFIRGTVLIDRDTGIFYVRPFGRQKKYALPLGDVATMVCRSIIQSELRAKQAHKTKKLVKRRRP